MLISTSFLSSKNIPKDLIKLNDTDTDYIHVDIMDGKFVKNKTMPFVATWFDLEIVILSKPENGNYHMISFTCGI